MYLQTKDNLQLKENAIQGTIKIDHVYQSRQECFLFAVYIFESFLINLILY